MQKKQKDDVVRGLPGGLSEWVNRRKYFGTSQKQVAAETVAALLDIETTPDRIIESILRSRQRRKVEKEKEWLRKHQLALEE